MGEGEREEEEEASEEGVVDPTVMLGAGDPGRNLATIS